VRQAYKTFGTLLNASGENPKVVQELLRHATLKVTTDTYMQALSSDKRQAQAKLVTMVRGKRHEAKPSKGCKFLKKLAGSRGRFQNFCPAKSCKFNSPLFR
jgi:hypothetical protein